MSDLFISYSRKDSSFVKGLHSALTEQGRDIWIDWEDIPPSAEWRSEIYAAIDASRAFLFVVSPASIASDVCAEELNHAIEQNKRLIPVVFKDSAEEQEIPDALRKLNFVFFRDTDDFDEALAKLVEAMDTDLDRVKAHTRLLVRAWEWERSNHHSLLLRSRDLADSERQFVGGAELDPRPTALQLRYLSASRKRATTVQRIILASVTGGMVIAITLAVIATVQRQYSDLRAGAAVVRNIATAKPMLALAHAINESHRRLSARVPEVRSSLLATLQTPKENAIYELDGRSPIASVVAGPDRSIVAMLDRRLVPDSGTSLTLWDGPGETHRVQEVGAAFRVVAGCSAQPLLLVGGDDGSLGLWELGPSGAPGPATPVDVAGIDDQRSDAPVWGAADFATVEAAAGTIRDVQVLDGADTGPPDASTAGQDAYGQNSYGVDSYGQNSYGADAYGQDSYGEEADSPDSAGEDADDQGFFGQNAYGIPERPTARPPDTSPAASGDSPARCLPGTAEIPAAFSSDCSRIAVVRDCFTEVWSVSADLELELEGKLAEPEVPRSIGMNANGEVIARGYSDGSIRSATWMANRAVYDDAPIAWHESGRAVDAIAVSPDGRDIVSADGRTVRLWRESDGMLTEVADGFHGHENRVTAVALDPIASAFVVSAGRDNSIRLWDLAGNPLVPPLLGHDSWVRSIAFTADGRSLVSAGNDGTVRRWPVSIPFRNGPCSDADGRIDVLAVSRDEDTLLIAEGGGRSVYLADGDCARKHQVSDSGRAVSKAGTWLAAMSSDGRFTAYGQAKGRAIWLQDTSGNLPEIEIEQRDKVLRAIAVNDDGTLVAFGGFDGLVRTWDRSDGSYEGFPLVHKLPITALAFSHDEKTIASGSEDNTVQLWDADTGERKSRLRGHKGWISSVAFSEDGGRVATGSWDNTARLWDSQGNPMGIPLRGHMERITHVTFPHESDSMISYGADGRIGVWLGGGADTWLDKACSRVSAYRGVRNAEENEVYERARKSCLPP